MNICMPDLEYLRKLVEEEPSKIYKQAERKILFAKTPSFPWVVIYKTTNSNNIPSKTLKNIKGEKLQYLFLIHSC